MTGCIRNRKPFLLKLKNNYLNIKRTQQRNLKKWRPIVRQSGIHNMQFGHNVTLIEPVICMAARLMMMPLLVHLLDPEKTSLSVNGPKCNRILLSANLSRSAMIASSDMASCLPMIYSKQAFPILIHNLGEKRASRIMSLLVLMWLYCRSRSVLVLLLALAPMVTKDITTPGTYLGNPATLSRAFVAGFT